MLPEVSERAGAEECVRANVAAVLRIETDAVSVKAKTSEGMGYTGDGTGIAAYAVACLTRSS